MFIQYLSMFPIPEAGAEAAAVVLGSLLGAIFDVAEGVPIPAAPPMFLSKVPIPKHIVKTCPLSNISNN